MNQMGCPAYALGVWVAFLKQPDALPSERPQENLFFIYDFLFGVFHCLGCALPVHQAV
jgi:hypothetical protein